MMEKISPIKKRILQFIENIGITKVVFCEKTSISYANLKGKGLQSEIGGEQIGKILSVYQQISAEWLLTGKGEMLRQPVSTAQEVAYEDKYRALLERHVALQEEHIALQRQLAALLEE
ncbi:MAG: hypothetical protein LBT94_05030 [Prevotellaceae bacterium]|nr:hypothetical protein [Prevotellaceae bacterium]